MLNFIKSNYFLIKMFEFLSESKRLKLINYNKNLQNILSISIDSYIKLFYQTEIKIIPKATLENDETKNIFININESGRKYFHIYFNEDLTQEIDRNFLKKDKRINKIRIIIDKESNMFSGLFKNCSCIKEIKFNKFNRLNVNDMSYMFNNCTSLIKLDIEKLKTNY